MKYIFIQTALLFFTLSFSFAQKTPTPDGLHRVVLNRNDTLYAFFAVLPIRKIETNPLKMYYWYKPDTILITQGGYSERILDGSYSVSYPNKNLKSKGQFSKGLKEGEWIYRHPDGRIQIIEYWKKGNKEGTFLTYDHYGKIIKKEKYKNDVKDGIQLQYSTLMNKWDTAYFKKGNLLVADSSKKVKR